MPIFFVNSMQSMLDVTLILKSSIFEQGFLSLTLQFKNLSFVKMLKIMSSVELS